MSCKKWLLLGLLLALPFTSCNQPLMKKSGAAPHYNITFEKEDNLIKASYDLSVPAGGSSLLADFKLYIDGKDLLQGQFKPGQTAFKSSVQYVLEHPDKDVKVGFSLATNQGWANDGSDVLRGAKRYDDASFRNP